MKIAISNIAWQIEEESYIAGIMQEIGIRGVEIAPTKIWRYPLSATNDEIEFYRNFWQSRGIEIIAMQSLLFGRQDLTIFQDSNKRRETFDYLSGMIELGSKLGASVLVFGSPKNRSIGNLDWREAEDIALSFFYNLGEIAVKHGLIFCIEPNPTAYNCDFITNSQQGLELVSKTNSKGFGLHLDAAGITLSQEAIETAIKQSLNFLYHFHISEPYLGQVGGGKVDHQRFSDTLTHLNYDRWKSIEMKAQNPDSNHVSVMRSLETAIKYYGN